MVPLPTGWDSCLGSSRAIVWALTAFVLPPLSVTFGKERACHPLWDNKDNSPALQSMKSPLRGARKKRRNCQLVAGAGEKSRGLAAWHRGSRMWWALDRTYHCFHAQTGQVVLEGKQVGSGKLSDEGCPIPKLWRSGPRSVVFFISTKVGIWGAIKTLTNAAIYLNGVGQR